MDEILYCLICDRRMRVLNSLDGKCSLCSSQQRQLADQHPGLFELRDRVRAGANPELVCQFDPSL